MSTESNPLELLKRSLRDLTTTFYFRERLSRFPANEFDISRSAGMSGVLTQDTGTSPVRYAKFESIRYFIDNDILQNCLIDIDIDIFQNHHIDIDIFGIALSISISISIFSKMTISILISISIFFKGVDISTIDMSYRYIEQGYALSLKFVRMSHLKCMLFTCQTCFTMPTYGFFLLRPAIALIRQRVPT